MDPQSKTNLTKISQLIEKYGKNLNLDEELAQLEEIAKTDPSRLMVSLYQLTYISLVRAEILEERFKEHFGIVL